MLVFRTLWVSMQAEVHVVLIPPFLKEFLSKLLGVEHRHAIWIQVRQIDLAISPTPDAGFGSSCLLGSSSLWASEANPQSCTWSYPPHQIWTSNRKAAASTFEIGVGVQNTSLQEGPKIRIRKCVCNRTQAMCIHRSHTSLQLKHSVPSSMGHSAKHQRDKEVNCIRRRRQSIVRVHGFRSGSSRTERSWRHVPSFGFPAECILMSHEGEYQQYDQPWWKKVWIFGSVVQDGLMGRLGSESKSKLHRIVDPCPAPHTSNVGCHMPQLTGLAYQIIVTFL